jgi:hypothetical protein
LHVVAVVVIQRLSQAVVLFVDDPDGSNDSDDWDNWGWSLNEMQISTPSNQQAAKQTRTHLAPQIQHVIFKNLRAQQSSATSRHYTTLDQVI